MKSLRNKVILSGIVLLFAFIATIGSTYAWFTVSTSTEIEEMTLNVTAADNLLLRIADGTENGQTIAWMQDASNYSTYISLADIQAAGKQIGINPDTDWRLQPSTVLTETVAANYGKTLAYLPNIGETIAQGGERTYGAASANSHTGQYIHLEFWLLSQSEEPQVIQLSDFDINVDGITTNTTEQNAIANAVRLSIWLDDTKYYDDVNDPDTGGTNNTAFLFGNDDEYDFEFFTGQTGYDGLNEDNNVAPTTTANFPVNTPADIATLNPDLFTVTFNTPTKINVLIYIEGWDAHASNDIILAAFNVSFGFKYKE
ncbi:MAG: hypothetical protein RBQ97_11845 [Acholeplasma sp.]|jgi:hypothetical protein|nr:hypothetical protein [Acholeplasma sp.]